jgi:hypothetical protein
MLFLRLPRQYWSPYVGMGNNPVSLVDPDVRQANRNDYSNGKDYIPREQSGTSGLSGAEKMQSQRWQNLWDNAGSMRTSFTLTGLSLSADFAKFKAMQVAEVQSRGWLYGAKLYGTVETGWSSVNPNIVRFGNCAQWASRSMVGLGAGISLGQGVNAYFSGDIDGAKKAALDLTVGVGAAWIGGFPGAAVYLFYLGIMQSPRGNPIPVDDYQAKSDNTKVAQPIILNPK